MASASVGPHPSTPRSRRTIINASVRATTPPSLPYDICPGQRRHPDAPTRNRSNPGHGRNESARIQAPYTHHPPVARLLPVEVAVTVSGMDGPGVSRGRDAAFDAPLWRALSIFRIAALGYALILIAHNVHVYAHPLAAWVVGAVMTVWTFASIYLYARPWRSRWPLLLADLVIMGTCLLV